MEVQVASGNGAEATDLSRTEMLHMDHTYVPNRGELRNIFCQTLESVQGHSIIMHTMDTGDDRPIDYLNIPAEANPFLGYRVVRTYEEYAASSTTQLRSILHASVYSGLKTTIPMISSMGGTLWVKKKPARAK